MQIQVEEELPTLLRRATAEEMLGFDNYKESNLPLPHFVSRFHHSHASTTNLVYIIILFIAFHIRKH